MKKEKDGEELEEESKEQEESDLEENVEEEQEIDEEKFVEFLSPSTETSPTTLNQIARAHQFRATDLEQETSDIPGIEDNRREENNKFQYNVRTNSEEGPKYISSEGEMEIARPPPRVDIMNLGKETNILPNEMGFSASPTTRIGESSDIEKYTSPKRFDEHKIRKENLFEKKEVKYEPSKEY